VVNPSLYEKLSYDPLKDFAPISIAGVSPNVLVVNPSLPVKSVKELTDYIRSHPGTNNFATPGAGTTPHLSGELFRVSLGLDLIPVPFNGAAPALQSTVGGHTPIAFTALPPATPLIRDGKLRALAVTSSARAPVLPDVPTMAEAGLKDQEADTLQGVLVPAGTPQPIVDLLHHEIVKIVQMPDVKQRFAAIGFDPVANTPAQFAAQLRLEIAKWGRVIKDAGIKLE
jgi:tripartite-type tricarboxylate transporter receptor subunit TctC